MSILGTRVLRTEDPKFLTTGGVYTEDVVDDRLDGAYHVFFVRSPLAHARISGINVSAALEAPGVVAVYTGADLAELPVIPPAAAGLMNVEMTQRLLAIDKVRFVGEPVAVVVTEHPYQGEDAIELVEVDYDPLPAVLGFEPDDSSLLFEAAGTNVAGNWGEASSLKPDLFEGCEVVVSHTIVNQRVAPAPMESRAGAAVWGEDGRLTTWIPNQGAQGTRDGLAKLLGLETSQVRVITPDVGGAFGAKFGADPEHAVIAWIARHLGHPARWTETRYENLIAMTHGRAQRHTVTIGGSRDGNVAGLPARDRPGRGRLPEDRRHPALPHHLDDLRAVRHPERRGHREGRGHQHHADRRVPRRRPAGGDGRARAGHGPVRHRDRRRPSRCPPQEPASAVHRATPDQVRRAVRHRRLRRRAGQGAGGGRIRRARAGSRPGGA